MSDHELRSKLIHLAHENPEVRPHVLPLLKTGMGPGKHIRILMDYFLNGWEHVPNTEAAIKEVNYYVDNPVLAKALVTTFEKERPDLGLAYENLSPSARLMKSEADLGKMITRVFKTTKMAKEAGSGEDRVRRTLLSIMARFDVVLKKLETAALMDAWKKAQEGLGKELKPFEGISYVDQYLEGVIDYHELKERISDEDNYPLYNALHYVRTYMEGVITTNELGVELKRFQRIPEVDQYLEGVITDDDMYEKLMRRYRGAESTY